MLLGPWRRSKTYGPPRLQEGFEDRSWRSAQTYPVSWSCAHGQDGDPRALVLIKDAASTCRFLNQAARAPVDLRPSSCPSRKHRGPPLAHGRAKQPMDYPATAPWFSAKARSRLSIAQAIRASLLASATMAMLR